MVFQMELPDQILFHVLARFPPEALYRIRTVSLQWKRVISAIADEQSKRSSTVRVMPGCQNPIFFSPMEGRWLPLPQSAAPSNENWTVADVDAGLVLYKSVQNDRLCLGISNPLMQNFQVIPWRCPEKPNFHCNPPCPSSSDGCARHNRIVEWNRPDVDRLEPCRRKGSHQGVKLWVGRELKTFRFILLSDTQDSTWVFDSVTCVWDGFNCQPGHIRYIAADRGLYGSYRLATFDSFEWKGIIYCYNNSRVEDFVLALDVKLKKWERIEAEFPCFAKSPWYKITQSKDQLILVQILTMGPTEKIFAVWKLLDKASSSVQDVSLSRWEKITTGSNMYMALGNVAFLSLKNVCCGNGCVFFLVSGYTVLDGFASGHKYHIPTVRCVRYNIASGIWCEIPSPSDIMLPWNSYNCKLYTWKLSLDMEPRLSIEGL